MSDPTKVVIDLRHVTGYAVGRTEGYSVPAVTLTTIDGRQHVLACRHALTNKQFVDGLSALLDRQSAGAALSGAGTELGRLSELVSRGVLTQADFDRAKGLMLGRPVSRVQESVQALEALHSLYRQGVLSESEFNLKKWDVLSK